MGNKVSHHSHPKVDELDNPISYENESNVELLQCKQIDMTSVMKNENTILHGLTTLDMVMHHIYAEEQMNVSKILLDKLIKGKDGYKIVHKIVEKATLESSNTGCYSKVLQVLLTRGLNVNIEDENGLTSVYYPVKKRCSRVIKMMKENGTDFSFITSKGQNALFWIFSDLPRNTVNDSLQEILFLLLLKEGCSVNLVDNSGQTPLHLASKAGQIFIVKQILAHDVEVNCQDYREKKTPLHLAVEKEFFEIAELLLNHGADVNKKDNFGNRPLHLAAAFKNRSMLQLLLKRGALVNARNNNGESAFVKVMQLEGNKSCKLEDIENSVNDLLMYGAGINNDSDASWIYQNWMHYSKSIIQAWIRAGSKHRFCPLYSGVEGYNLYFKFYEKYYPEWLKEMETMKNTMIDSHTSIYDWLNLNSNWQCIYIHNEKLRDIVDSPMLEGQYPNYCTVILGTYRKLVTRKLLIERAKETWNKFTKMYWPDVCIEHIFSYLNNGDLIDVMELADYGE